MQYNSPFVKILETIANMLIVSFFWIIFSLPIVTVVPSTAALYHTTNKVIFGPGRGNGVFKCFWDTFKENLKKGFFLSLIIVVALAFIAEGLWTGYQLFKVNVFGMLYMILGILITIAIVPAMTYASVMLSRFDAPVTTIIRLSLYFSLKKPLMNVLSIVLIGFFALLLEIFPLSIMITPALYADFLRPFMEKSLKKFIEENVNMGEAEDSGDESAGGDDTGKEEV
jgi:uncharacterized membrane protein YesL